MFILYIRGGISFVIVNEHLYKAQKESPRDSGYLDEAFIRERVKRENITGVMIPENLLDSSLADLQLGLAKMGYAYIDQRCRQVIGSLESETGYHAETEHLEALIQQKQELEKQELDFFEKDKQRKAIFEQMEQEMGNIISKAFAQKLEKFNY